MGYRREPIEIGEWYHCYNRGIDKRDVFDSEADCERFLQSLYLSNDTDRTGRNNFEYMQHSRIFTLDRSSPLVSIGAYCLMPNHFHIFMQEVTESGISRFMHKLGTSYTMYYNERNERVGNLFYKPFRSRHVNKEAYFRHVPNYIHLNAAELFELDWKKGRVRSVQQLHNQLKTYRFSSFADYAGTIRPENSILDMEAISILRESASRPGDLIAEAAKYMLSVRI